MGCRPFWTRESGWPTNWGVGSEDTGSGIGRATEVVSTIGETFGMGVNGRGGVGWTAESDGTADWGMATICDDDRTGVSGVMAAASSKCERVAHTALAVGLDLGSFTQHFSASSQSLSDS